MYSNLHFEYCDTKYKQINQKAGTNADTFNQVLREKYGALRFTVLSIHTTALWYSNIFSMFPS